MKEDMGGQRMETVWRHRAHRLAQRPDLAGDGENAFPVVVLGIGTERYGVDLQDVTEVLPPVRATPVPGAPEAFAGVINVHGEIRPVIDLARWLGMNTIRSGHAARVIVLYRNSREMGLQVDSVEQIRWVSAGDLQPVGNGSAGSSSHIKGSTKDLLMLLNTEALFSQMETGTKT